MLLLTAALLANISYGPHERNVLDFYRADSGKPTPLVVFIHGGGFVSGSKANLNPAMRDRLRDMSPAEREKILSEAKVQLQEAMTGSRRPDCFHGNSGPPTTAAASGTSMGTSRPC